MSEENSLRLAKRMVELGLCSRREADEYIELGQVKVDGEVVRVLGCRVRPDQTIELSRSDTPLDTAPATLLLHREDGAATDWSTLIHAGNRSAHDHSGRTLLPRHLRRQTAFGAIDAGSSGLVVLSQDRRILSRLPECEQEFLVGVEQAPQTGVLTAAAAGVPGCRVTRQSDRQLRFVLNGPDRAAMAAVCAEIGCPPLSMRCIRIGRLAMGPLAAGSWRFLLRTDRF